MRSNVTGRRRLGRAARWRAHAWLCTGMWALLMPVAARGDVILDKGAAAKGQIVYVRYCLACHGNTGRGDGSLSKDLRVAVPDVTTLSARNQGAYPYDRIVRIVTHGELLAGHGTADMPAWGDAFRNTQGTGTPHVNVAIRHLAHYIWSIQRKPDD